MTLRCGCTYDENARRFVHHCRERAIMVLKKRAEKYNFPTIVIERDKKRERKP